MDVRPEFQSTLPMKGATSKLKGYFSLPDVSIHAPNEGSDTTSAPQQPSGQAFQSTLPMKGATMTFAFNKPIQTPFQSTLPMKGATLAVICMMPVSSLRFNPRSQ